MKSYTKPLFSLSLSKDVDIALAVSVQLLLLAESSEIVLPLAYLLCFTAAFYGPNAFQLGNVRNSYWLYKVFRLE